MKRPLTEITELEFMEITNIVFTDIKKDNCFVQRIEKDSYLKYSATISGLFFSLFMYKTNNNEVEIEIENYGSPNMIQNLTLSFYAKIIDFLRSKNFDI